MVLLLSGFFGWCLGTFSLSITNLFLNSVGLLFVYWLLLHLFCKVDSLLRLSFSLSLFRGLSIVLLGLLILLSLICSSFALCPLLFIFDATGRLSTLYLHAIFFEKNHYKLKEIALHIQTKHENEIPSFTCDLMFIATLTSGCCCSLWDCKQYWG